MAKGFKVRGVGGMTIAELRAAVGSGARFVVYPYAESWVVVSFRRVTDPILVRPTVSSGAGKAAPLLHSLLFGWWGIPWGPIFTIQGVFRTLRGGVDVTSDVMADLEMLYRERPLEPLPKA
ncbi:MAG TPA: hypothetical protein VFI15_03965 [Candidatus Limnocylindrales bacterium]|nr:hypothetical protein [Candidatus Limnocylindrales bacterium]